MVVITTRGQERRLRAEALGDFEAEYSTVEGDRSLEVGNLQVDMPDTNFRIDGIPRKGSRHL